MKLVIHGVHGMSNHSSPPPFQYGHRIEHQGDNLLSCPVSACGTMPNAKRVQVLYFSVIVREKR